MSVCASGLNMEIKCKCPGHAHAEMQSWVYSSDPPKVSHLLLEWGRWYNETTTKKSSLNSIKLAPQMNCTISEKFHMKPRLERMFWWNIAEKCLWFHVAWILLILALSWDQIETHAPFYMDFPLFFLFRSFDVTKNQSRAKGFGVEACQAIAKALEDKSDFEVRVV